MAQTKPEDDPMFGKIVRGSQTWHQHQQDINHLETGMDPDTGEQTSTDDD